MTIEQGIAKVYNGVNHVVILGAGASIASTIRNNEAGGKILPSIHNFIDVIGLRDIVETMPEHLNFFNFEQLYSNLIKNNHDSNEVREIERRITSYFSDMSLPKEPTIYDYLIASLRKKDLIATFNWDPFLFQAIKRNSKFTDNEPKVVFLHGNVAIGYNEQNNQYGPSGRHSYDDGAYFTPTKLLYPVEKKNYNDDKFIRTQWDLLEHRLNIKNGSARTTIFGYGAPNSDVEAVSLLSKSWGTPEAREMEQFEIIDISPKDQLKKRWDKFIFSHHYDIVDNYFDSSLALNPRRTCESHLAHTQPFTIEEAFRNDNPVPQNFRTLQELWDWHSSLLRAENFSC